jgi:hypothetical protein
MTSGRGKEEGDGDEYDQSTIYVCMYENSIMKTTKTVKEEVVGVRS